MQKNNNHMFKNFTLKNMRTNRGVGFSKLFKQIKIRLLMNNEWQNFQQGQIETYILMQVLKNNYCIRGKGSHCSELCSNRVNKKAAKRRNLWVRQIIGTTLGVPHIGARVKKMRLCLYAWKYTSWIQKFRVFPQFWNISTDVEKYLKTNTTWKIWRE